jgi:hypothetical protein
MSTYPWNEDLWVVAMLFDPLGRNLEKTPHFAMLEAFRNHLPANLAVVEISGNGSFAVPDHAADMVIRLVSDQVIWHQEAAINVAVSRLPPSCSIVAWIDVDLRFPVQTWPALLRQRLTECSAVQLFSSIRYLDQNGATASALATGAPQIFPSAVAALTRDPPLQWGMPGGAWGARRDVFVKAGGLFDFCPVGGGDTVWALTLLDRAEECIQSLRFNAKTAEHYRRWAKQMAPWINSVGCLDLQLDHAWHGPIEGRGYLTRRDILEQLGFDPAVHLGRDHQGLLRWSACAGELANGVRGHFLAMASGQYQENDAARPPGMAADATD